MKSLQRPFFFLAIALIVVIVLVDIGASIVIPGLGGHVTAGMFPEGSEEREAFESIDQNELEILSGKKPPGLGIPYMALLDGVVLFTVALMGASLVIPQRVHGRVQGCATLIFSLMVILGGIAMIFVAIGLLLLMISLVLSFFGFFTYLAIYGFFDRGGASVLLGLLMMLKLGFAICLIIAHRRFLENKGLVLIVFTSFLGIVIISFLHGLVPGIFVSITDALGAIIVAIFAVFWAVFLLIGSLGSVTKAIRPDRA
ncbi:MAG: hypothetical protein GTO18_11075 [Anaerolineales bacterium]|nr:hypothetical protein [Anaerolineales bacterium]